MRSRLFSHIKMKKMKLPYSKTLWASPDVPWQHLSIRWGCRNSDMWQIIPIKNVSDNCNRAIMIGFWKAHITISYSRAGYFNQKRKLPFRRRLLKFYQLFA